MTDTLVATFPTQFAAASAVDRLLSRGLLREHLLVRTDESVAGSPSASSAPTTVVSAVSHREPGRGEPAHVRTPPQPEGVGQATVTVVLGGALPPASVLAILEQAGARAISRTSRAEPPREDGAYWPDPGSAPAPDDVVRAVEAVPGHARHPDREA